MLIGAEFLIQLVHAGFMLILNLFMRNKGLSDDIIAGYTSHRYLAVLIFALPLGIFIKGKRLKPFLILGSIIFPIASFLILYAIEHDIIALARTGFFIWGTGLMFMQVSALPFIMRYTTQELESEAIALNYSSFSVGLILSGSLIYFLTDLPSNWGFMQSWGEYPILLLLAAIAAFAPLFTFSLTEPNPEKTEEKFELSHLKSYDWMLILKAVFPTAVLAVGAGLTIPYMNLFFNAVFDVDSSGMSQIGGVTAVLVFVGALLVPGISKRFGYKIAITLTQVVAVFFLYILAVTELFTDYWFAFPLAISCFMIRQPLMNMAGPMTSELVMNYVGKKNQELVSAIISSIWSGSWFLSAKAFQIFRKAGLPYWEIFLMTAIFYTIGVLLYYFLIKDYYRRDALINNS